MSRPPSDPDVNAGDLSEAAEDELLGALSDALAETGELIPTDEAQVARFEAELDHDLELPPSLSQLGTTSEARETPESRALKSQAPESQVPKSQAPESVRHAEVVQLAPARRGRYVGHLVSATLGAAAASLLFVATGPGEPPAGLPAGEPPRPVDATTDSKTPVRLSLDAGSCEAPCCAGADCKAPDLSLTAPAAPGKQPGEALRQCSSGRRCIACTGHDASRFRLRVGGLVPADAGRELMAQAQKGQLELCFRAGASAAHCVDAHASSDGDATWRDLPLVLGAPDLIAGLALELRWKGAARPVATWASPVRINPTLLCNGLSLRPTNPKGDLIGSLSAFFVDTHYLELSRGASIAELKQAASAFDFGSLSPKVFELSAGAAPSAPRFALVLGPYSEAQAESLRAQALEQGASARTVIGAEHRGASMPLRQSPKPPDGER